MRTTSTHPETLPDQDSIMSQWSTSTGPPLVSICSNTYNHEQFIEDALRGFLIQDTDFPFEIIVRDDASTDGTAGIIRSYQKRYPLLIRGIYEKENQYAKCIPPTTRIFPKARGKYIAFCDGDDSWTDPHKLQIQFDYLENHPGIVISGHPAISVDRQGKEIPSAQASGRTVQCVTGEQLIRGDGYMQSLSWMFRNVELDNAPERRMVRNGDRFILSLLGHYGGSHYHTDIQPGRYRVHEGGVWSMLSQKNRMEAHINTWYWMYRYYARTGQQAYADHYWRKFLQVVFLRSSSKELTERYLRKIGLPRKLVSAIMNILAVLVRR
ncbi:glycosyltransferase family 2 protein [Prosthecochloris sp. N3]|uniref:Glycosyltransferase family 2 protein n=1 Tax=Prosthecochloris ethylica TaxID=2743976 RepID=A0ABR9XR39_9CHLB|nr:glycosyltransferase family 2 protein [Prosthecochloris ethylica]MBF0586364.1 glycosyltransferase family 2 protein [Prosthecochloris ethylica]MBF0636418.1 glycosyltransferase family 2 protein [Prosthecochloris ethylica]MEC9487012.1 glycosyltransferase family 2 protein [Prosthecochloris sp.]NUK47592.1 glycosyltransferase family 2 protein [Prosthecochloris ethylica]